MSPLIDQFTKNLSDCSGCGSNGVWQLIPTKEGIMQFQIQIIVEAENLIEAVKQFDGKGEVMSVNARPQQQRTTIGLPSVPTNMRTGLPVNG